MADMTAVRKRPIRVSIADRRVAIPPELVQLAIVQLARRWIDDTAGDPESRARGKMLQLALKGVARLMLAWAEHEIIRSGADRPLPDYKAAKEDITTYTLVYLSDDLLDGLARQEWTAYTHEGADGSLEVTGVAATAAWVAPAAESPAGDGGPEPAAADRPAEPEPGPTLDGGFEPALVRGGSDTQRENNVRETPDHQSAESL